MDMEQSKKNLEEALEQIDLLSKEKDNLEDKYGDAKVYIGKLKDKIDDMKSKNKDLRSQLSQVPFELDSIKIEHTKLEKYNIIVKGELTQTKQKLEKLYSSSEKIDEKISIQRFYHQFYHYQNIISQVATWLVLILLSQ